MAIQTETCLRGRAQYVILCRCSSQQFKPANKLPGPANPQPANGEKNDQRYRHSRRRPTAIGTFGGSLASTAPIDLATVASEAALERSGVAPEQIGHVVFGHVINTEPRDMYLSRMAAIQAGIPNATPALNVNRLCGSAAQAIVSAI